MKQRIKKIAQFVIILLSIATIGYTQENIGKENEPGKKASGPQKKVITADAAKAERKCAVAVILFCANCRPDERSVVSAQTEKELGSDSARVIPGAEIREKLGAKADIRCVSASCALEYGRTISADFIVYGSVDRFVQEYKKPLDEKGDYRYLVQKIKNVRYVFNVTLYDRGAEKNIVTFAEKCDENGFAAAMKKMSRAFGPYLVKKIDHEEVPVKKEPAPVRDENKPRAELSLFGSGILPHDTFRKIISGGAGAGFTAGVSNLIIPNNLFMVSGKYINGAFKSSGTTSFNSFDLMLYWGMYIPLADKFRLLPLVGVGCQFSFATFTAPLSGPQKKRYIDPILGVALEGDIELPKGFAILVAPEFNIFFEKKSVGIYTGLRVGAKYRF